MAINKAMRLALKALSYPDIDIRKTLKIERAAKQIKAPHLLGSLYRNLDRKIFSDGREVGVRVYTPVERESDHILLFFHGGGWATESVETYNRVCVGLARNLKCRVVSVEYALAPESPFPEGLQDCYAVAKELYQNPEQFETTADHILLIGDSAGGNLAAAVSLMARDRGEFASSRQILIYPATAADHSEDSPFPSVRENGKDYLLTSKRICEYMELYAAKAEDFKSPYFAPLLTESYADQPETLLISAEFDPLRDEGEEYARRLEAAGNRVVIRRMPDALHGYFSLDEKFPLVQETYALIGQFMREEL
ncbi:MAG: alpha/beta hydrolase [Candidatus Howiella sp.]|jgi:acetyl esterase